MCQISAVVEKFMTTKTRVEKIPGRFLEAVAILETLQEFAAGGN
jgi:hypothetical protein